jgi:hypothetical protein
MHACVRTDEVNDEAAVGAAAGGVAEVVHAVGQARRGEVVRDAVHHQVAGVHQGVPEVEDGRVLPRRRRPRRPHASRRGEEDEDGGARHRQPATTHDDDE